MKTELLLNYFDRICEFPAAVPRLRRFVLELAVRRTLVGQRSADEPAEELLSRLQAKKREVLGNEGRGVKRQSSEVHDPRLTKGLPRGWILTTLGSIALKITDGTHKTPTYVHSGVPFVSVKDFSGGRLDLSGTRFITPEEHKQLYKRCDPRRGDILIGRIGTLGEAVLVDTDIEFSLFVSVGLIQFSHDFIAPQFMRLLLNPPSWRVNFIE